MCLDYLTDDLSSWWESKLKDCEFKLLSACILYIYELIVSQLWVRRSVRYITHNSYAISVMSSFNRLWAQVNEVISCLKSQKDICLGHLSWWFKFMMRK